MHLLLRFLSGQLTGEGGEPEAPFEQVVPVLEVVTQVGVGAWRVELLIRDGATGHYRLGVACDGATAHARAIARPRSAAAAGACAARVEDTPHLVGRLVTEPERQIAQVLRRV